MIRAKYCRSQKEKVRVFDAGGNMHLQQDYSVYFAELWDREKYAIKYNFINKSNVNKE